MPELLKPKFEREEREMEHGQLESDALRVAEALVNVQQGRIIALEKRLEEMEAELNTDKMTGTRNERGLHEFIEKRKMAAERQEDSVVMFLDANHFKDINDTMGHAAGDFVIQEIASYLHRIARPEDLVVRLHGDEFVVVFSGVDEPAIIERFKDEPLKFTIEFQGKEIEVSLSAGITAYHLGDPLEEALDRADQAMYTAKQRRDGSVSSYELM